MKSIHILGVSENSIAILFDVLKENEQMTSFTLYPNIASDVKPSFPNSKINYKIMPFGEAPKVGSKVFYGCSTSKIKEKIPTYFNQNHQLKNDNYHKIIHNTS